MNTGRRDFAVPGGHRLQMHTADRAAREAPELQVRQPGGIGNRDGVAIDGNQVAYLDGVSWPDLHLCPPTVDRLSDEPSSSPTVLSSTVGGRSGVSPAAPDRLAIPGDHGERGKRAGAGRNPYARPVPPIPIGDGTDEYENP